MKTCSHIIQSVTIVSLIYMQTCHTVISPLNTSTSANKTSPGHVRAHHIRQVFDDPAIMLAMNKFDVDKRIKEINSIIRTILHDIPQRQKFKENLYKLEEKVKKIENYFREWEVYDIVYNGLVDDEILDDKLQDMVNKSRKVLTDEPDTPADLMIRLIDLMVSGKPNILEELEKKSLTYSSSCSVDDHQESLQLLLNDYFSEFVAIQFKVFFTMSSSEKIWKEYRQENYKNLTQINYERVANTLHGKFSQLVEYFKTIMQGFSRNVWRCDPTDHKEGRTYIKLNNVFQVHLRSSKDLPSGDECYNSTWKSLTNCLHDVDQYKRKCFGSINRCQKISDLQYDTDVCLSDSSSARAYEYVKVSSNSIIEGDSTSIYGLDSKDCKNLFLVDAGEVRLWFPFIKKCCAIYACVCDQTSDYDATGMLSERMFYNGTVEADVSDNYIVTGVRLRKYLGVIYIQIQQGQLTLGGYVNGSTLEWKEIPDESLLDPNNHFKLSWSSEWEGRTIELQDVEVPQGHALVGVKLHVEGNKHGPLRLAASSRSFDFIMGQLGLDDSGYHNNMPPLSGERIEADGLELPDKTFQYNISVSNKLLSFGVSNIQSDFGQTTLPFLDIQDVVMSKPRAMSGVGLYYRKSNVDTHAGFLAIKLRAYDLSEHLLQGYQ